VARSARHFRCVDSGPSQLPRIIAPLVRDEDYLFASARYRGLRSATKCASDSRAQRVRGDCNGGRGCARAHRTCSKRTIVATSRNTCECGISCCRAAGPGYTDARGKNFSRSRTICCAHAGELTGPVIVLGVRAAALRKRGQWISTSYGMCELRYVRTTVWRATVYERVANTASLRATLTSRARCERALRVWRLLC